MAMNLSAPSAQTIASIRQAHGRSYLAFKIDEIERVGISASVVIVLFIHLVSDVMFVLKSYV